MRGVLISGVLRGGPADNAGIEPGDVVLDINNQPVTDARQAMKVISEEHPDTLIELTGARQGRQFTVKARVSQRPAQAVTND